MHGHSTSYWRPASVNSQTRVSCLRPMHHFHRGASHQERWGLDQTHSYVTGLYVLSWEWPTRCPGIACYPDEEHHMSVWIGMCVFHTTSPGIVLSWREAPRAHYLTNTMAFPKGQFHFRFGTTWQHDVVSPRESRFQEVPNNQTLMPGYSTSGRRPTTANSQSGGALPTNMHH